MKNLIGRGIRNYPGQKIELVIARSLNSGSGRIYQADDLTGADHMIHD